MRFKRNGKIIVKSDDIFMDRLDKVEQAELDCNYSNTIEELKKYLNVNDFMKALKYKEKSNEWYCTIRDNADQMDYWILMSDKVYQYLMADRQTISFKIGYGNGVDFDMTSEEIKALSIQIHMLDEENSIDWNKKQAEESRERLKNYSPKQRTSNSTFRWGGLEDDEADLAYWNCD